MDPAQLREALFGGRDLFVRALTEKLMMYALGRELEYYDMPQVRAVVRRAAAQDYRLSAIVSGIVASDAFRMQAADACTARSRISCRAELSVAKEGLTMFLTKKHLSRRTVLRGAGVTLALPLLDAMIPAATALAQTAAVAEDAHGILLHPARRDHGQHVASAPRWTGGRRAASGADFKLSPDPEVARAAQALRHVVRQPPEPARWWAACTAWRRPRG